MWSLLLGFLFIFALVRYHWRRRHLYSLANKCSGPLNLPFIGNAHYFLFCKNDDILDKLYELVENTDQVSRFWLGPELVMIFKNPNHVQKILFSAKFSHKHDIYRFVKPLLGEGLITASGAKHRNDRRKIQPFVNLQFSSESIPIFEKYTKLLNDKLKPLSGRSYFEIGHIIHLCTTDIISELIFGFKMEAMNTKNSEYVNGFKRIYELGAERLLKPWLYPEFIYNLTSNGQESKKICEAICKLMQKLILETKQRDKEGNSSNMVVDKLVQHNFDDYDLQSHLITLFMASEDTIALIVSGACLCFGMYPKYQKKAVDEIESVFEASEPITVEKIVKLTYLDMCVKEVLRIFPIAPYITRKTVENQQVDELFLPKNCGIMIPIYNLHRDLKYWENPTHFHPDHFLPDAEKTRPNCTYVPFSEGPRSCIGKIFANISVKVMIIHLLRKFEFEARGKLPDVKFKMDISTRSLDGYHVKIKLRGNRA